MIQRMGVALLLPVLLCFAGCKDAKDAVDKTTSEITGYRAYKQSQGAAEKIQQASQMEQERLRKTTEVQQQAE